MKWAWFSLLNETIGCFWHFDSRNLAFFSFKMLCLRCLKHSVLTKVIKRSLFKKGTVLWPFMKHQKIVIALWKQIKCNFFDFVKVIRLYFMKPKSRKNINLKEFIIKRNSFYFKQHLPIFLFYCCCFLNKCIYNKIFMFLYSI